MPTYYLSRGRILLIQSSRPTETLHKIPQSFSFSLHSHHTVAILCAYSRIALPGYPVTGETTLVVLEFLYNRIFFIIFLMLNIVVCFI